jgi:hypothetical protein
LAINSLYTSFNHGCEPNIKVSLDEKISKTTRIVSAIGDILKREEGFIIYLNDDALGLPCDDRRKTSGCLTGGDC